MCPERVGAGRGESRPGGYRRAMTTAPLEPAADPALSPDAPDPVAPGEPGPEPDPQSVPEES